MARAVRHRSHLYFHHDQPSSSRHPDERDGVLLELLAILSHKLHIYHYCCSSSWRLERSTINAFLYVLHTMGSAANAQLRVDSWTCVMYRPKVCSRSCALRSFNCFGRSRSQCIISAYCRTSRVDPNGIPWPRTTPSWRYSQRDGRALPSPPTPQG